MESHHLGMTVFNSTTNTTAIAATALLPAVAAGANVALTPILPAMEMFQRCKVHVNVVGAFVDEATLLGNEFIRDCTAEVPKAIIGRYLHEALFAPHGVHETACSRVRCQVAWRHFLNLPTPRPIVERARA